MCWNPHGILLKSLNHAILKSWVFIYLWTVSEWFHLILQNIIKSSSVVIAMNEPPLLPQLFWGLCGVWTHHKDLKSHTHTSWVQEGGTRLVVLYRGIIPCIPDASNWIFTRDFWRPLEAFMKTMMTGHTELPHQFCCGGQVDFVAAVAKSWIVDRLGV